MSTAVEIMTTTSEALNKHKTTYRRHHPPATSCAPHSILPEFLEIGFSPSESDEILEPYVQTMSTLRQGVEAIIVRTARILAACSPSSSSDSMARARTMIEKRFSLSVQVTQQHILKSVRTLAVKEHPTTRLQRRVKKPVFKTEFTPLLEDFFSSNRYPTTQEKAALARKTGMSFQQIYVWFQNHRNRHKKDELTEVQSPSSEDLWKLSPEPDRESRGQSAPPAKRQRTSQTPMVSPITHNASFRFARRRPTFDFFSLPTHCEWDPHSRYQRKNDFWESLNQKVDVPKPIQWPLQSQPQSDKHKKHPVAIDDEFNHNFVSKLRVHCSSRKRGRDEVDDDMCTRFEPWAYYRPSSGRHPAFASPDSAGSERDHLNMPYKRHSGTKPKITSKESSTHSCDEEPLTNKASLHSNHSFPWSMKHLRNPCQSKRTREAITQNHGRGSHHVESWFVDVRKQIDCGAISEQDFASKRVRAVDAATAFLATSNRMVSRAEMDGGKPATIIPRGQSGVSVEDVVERHSASSTRPISPPSSPSHSPYATLDEAQIIGSKRARSHGPSRRVSADSVSKKRMKMTSDYILSSHPRSVTSDQASASTSDSSVESICSANSHDSRNPFPEGHLHTEKESPLLQSLNCYGIQQLDGSTLTFEPPTSATCEAPVGGIDASFSIPGSNDISLSDTVKSVPLTVESRGSLLGGSPILEGHPIIDALTLDLLMPSSGPSELLGRPITYPISAELDLNFDRFLNEDMNQPLFGQGFPTNEQPGSRPLLCWPIESTSHPVHSSKDQARRHISLLRERQNLLQQEIHALETQLQE
ncbi:hypothetical protein NP233_g6006 [Leucocoprinus birnbaumii]|uniref:Homeobox domain-containing protein n=1 Tax=Leucocoprinus birnbaumii TaxID=56174 RepID=A0AAD5YU16_9AGAR|nr:hypothetical protein NP233_g6006 [Leucocoprinus birnbaumii]